MNKQNLIIMTAAATLTLAASCTSNKEAQPDNGPLVGKTEIVADHLTPELLQELGKISDMQASPDGSKVLYAVGYTSVKQDKTNRELFVLDVTRENAESVQITRTECSEQNAVWSKDGSKIYFLSSESGSMQMWQMNADGTARKQISDLDKDIEGFLLSPNQDQVLVILPLDIPRIDSTLFEGLDKTTGRLWDDMNYRHWDDFVNNCPHPFIAPFGENGLNKDALIDIMEGEPYECPMRPFGGIESFAWNPNGSQIVYATRKEVGTQYAFSTRSSIYLYDIVTGQTFDLHPGDHGYDTCPTFSPDGKLLAFQAMARNGYESDKNALLVMNLDGFPMGNDGDWDKATNYIGKFKDLTANYDNNCEAYVWTPDGKALTFVSYSYGTAQVFNATLDGVVTRISDNSDHDFGAVAYVGKKLLTLRHDWHQPNEIFELKDGVATQLTHENDALLAQLGDMGRIEKRWMKCTNGDTMLVWIAYPAGFDGAISKNPNLKVPTLLYCQGGPESAVSQFWSTRWNIAIMQANGYALVLPNRHGVPGFGQKFNEQIAGDFAGQCMRDYFTTIDNIAKTESWCDADRLGAVGASFGGYSVYWLAGHHQKRFKCFIAHCGIFNCESMYGETEEMWFADWDYGGSYFGQSGLQEGLCHTPKRGNGGINPCYTDSPHKSITKWDTPILVIHNEHDYRIPVTQGMQAFNLARMRGIPAEFLYFPNESHWVLHPQNAVLWQRVYFNWLDKWLKK